MTIMEAAFDPVYGEAWNRRQVSDALAMPSTHALVLDSDGDPIESGPCGQAKQHPAGFVLTRFAADEEELLLIAVTPEMRGRGLGEKLMQHFFDMAKSRGVNRIFLEMRRGNPAVHLYQKVGFEPIGQRRNYYRLSNGERVDAITFGRSL
ncbi:ribosomal-protein-alanine acetyltransferase [Erythrobacter sp. KY5]|uniref:GNAT family N-acetyltransferase n=1 Tax=Erythrobacter sp. KY5 TaxID=2011159 RepID=UPI000DBF1CDC|nr:GNAT family N-acetyltransferase [Erythrobacter sp. KY5]AWW75213.1 ribosomal-protein-alanine acetyltransferase [Erythrobacter sp. KY5]